MFIDDANLKDKKTILKNLKRLNVNFEDLTFRITYTENKTLVTKYELITLKDYEKFKALEKNLHQVIIKYYIPDHIEKLWIDDECYITRKWNPDKLKPSLRERAKKSLIKAILKIKKKDT